MAMMSVVIIVYRLGQILPVDAASPKHLSTRSSLSSVKRKASSPKRFKALATLASCIFAHFAAAANYYGGKAGYQPTISIKAVRIVAQVPFDFFLLLNILSCKIHLLHNIKMKRKRWRFI